MGQNQTHMSSTSLLLAFLVGTACADTWTEMGSSERFTATVPYGLSLCSETQWYGVAEYGHIGLSTDTGASWTGLFQDRSSDTRSLHLLASYNRGTSHLYSCGNKGTLLISTDGGTTFTDHAATINTLVGSEENLQSIFAASDNDVYVVGDNVFVKTSDGGTNWELVTHQAGSTATLRGIHCSDVNKCYIAGGVKALVWHGGTSFVYADVESGNVQHAYAVSDSIAYMAGYAGYMMKTTDAGVTWTQIGSGVTTERILGITFLSDYNDIGFIIAGSTVYKTADAGATWAAEDCTSCRTDRLFSISCFGTACATGDQSGYLRKLSSVSVPTPTGTPTTTGAQTTASPTPPTTALSSDTSSSITAIWVICLTLVCTICLCCAIGALVWKRRTRQQEETMQAFKAESWFRGQPKESQITMESQIS